MQVASGQSSAIGGGSSNKASGYYSCIPGGFGNEAAGQGAFACGWGSSATGDQSAAFGGGRAHYASSIAIGNSAFTKVTGQTAFSCGTFTLIGEAQTTITPLRAITSDPTPTVLTTNEASPSGSGTGQPNVPTLISVNSTQNAARVIEASVVAMDSDTGDTKVWKITGAAKYIYIDQLTQIANIVGTPTKTVIAADSAALNWDCNLVVNTTRRSAEIEVIGEAGKTIRWYCSFVMGEVN